MTTPAERTAVNTEQIAANTDPGNPATPMPEQSVTPTTTSEEDLQTADHRAEQSIQRADQRDVASTRASRQSWINLIWEYTQSFVAVTVVLATAAGVFIGRVIQTNAVPFPAEWWTIVGLVIGFYFGRTNHARMGDEPRGGRVTDGQLDDR